jgi:gluconate kinase
MLFEDNGYDGDALDYQQLKQDNINHKLTSIGNLRGFTSAMAATPVDRKERRRMMKDPTIPARHMYYRKSNTRGKEQVQDCIDWLNLNAHELPSELENEKGESSGHTVMVNVGTVEDRIADIAVADASREDDRVGLYFREGIDALNPRMSTFSTLTSKNATDKQLRSLLLAAGFGTESVQNFLAAVKAESYQRYAIKQAKGLRWRGMQEYNGVTRAIEEEAKGLKLKPAKSGAKPMPPSERLNELLSYDSETGSLVWKVSRGRVKAGSVAYRVDKGLPRTRVDGTDYYTARIIWAMVEGDPLNNTVVCRDKDALNLRWSNLNLETTANSTATGGTVVRERSMMQDKYRAEIRVSAKQLIVIGYFDTEEEAIAAKILFINTCKR